MEEAPRDEFFVTEEDFEGFRDQIETGKEPDQNGWERFVANGTEEMDYVAWRRDPDVSAPPVPCAPPAGKYSHARGSRVAGG